MWHQLLQNQALVLSVLAMVAAQVLKVPLYLISDGKLDLSRVFTTGGMPSSHSAFVAALTTVFAKQYGLDHPYVAISIVFGAIVMYDAANIRRQAGKHAQLLNILVKQAGIVGKGLSSMVPGHGKNRREGLKEMLGHEPLEVLGGAILGIMVGLYG